MKNLRGKPHIVLAGLVVLILVAESALFYSLWTSFAANERWTVHTHEVLEKIESFLSEMKDAETGQRGYLLTGKEQYLEPYGTAVQAVPVQFEELRKLTSDNPSQQSRIETLRSLIDAKLAELKETIELRRTRGAGQAIAVVSTDRGKQIMDRIRVVIQEMKAEELSLLDRRNQRRLATARFLMLTMASGVGLLLIVLVAGSRAIDRSTTARALAEAAEQTQRERRHARSLLEASLDPLVTISPGGQITDANEAAELVTGVPRDRLVGSDFSDYFTEPDRARAGYRKVLSDGLVRDYPLTVRHVEGHTTDVLYNAVVYRNEAGQVQGVFAAARDVTERKRLEEGLRVASLYARSLLEASLDPLVTISPGGQITDVNEAAELVTGVPRSGLVGSDFSDYFTEPDRARAGYRKVLSDGLVRDYPLTIRHLDGHTTDVLYNAVVYRNEAGQVQGVFAAARDVTERKRAEAELTRYREHLEELVQQRTSELETANAHLRRTTAELASSNQELEQFAYVASHDLQEPLRAVTGYLGLIERQLGDQLEDKVRHFVDGAVQGASRMHTLITDLLALSRVGTRGQALEPADLNAVLDQTLEGLGASVRETGARITRDPLPILCVDAGQMAQLFQNLVGNALKFRGERPPEIHVSAGPKPGQWVFGVRDNGIGIESQYFERIFLVFQRLHTRKHYPGTGIGLAICKKIVERHGGAIWVESQPGEGSTFYFSIPNGENHGDPNNEPRSGPAD
jgi:PAS domain S-box-containing protein